MKAALGDVKGLTNLHADLPRVEPTVQVEVDLEKAKEVGVKPGDVRRAAGTSVWATSPTSTSSRRPT